MAQHAIGTSGSLAKEEKGSTKPYRRRWQQLRDDQTSWRTHWTDIQNYIVPRKGKFLTSETENAQDEGVKQNDKIINGTANDAIRTVAAGLQGGLISPAQPWFQFGLRDKEILEAPGVREWLQDVRDEMLNVMSKSNFYSATHGIFTELAGFGTGAMLIEEDFQTVIRSRPFTIGEYALAQSPRLRVDTLYRKFQMTARQMIKQFGESEVSQRVIQSMNQNRGETRYEVLHAIQPRDDFMPGDLGQRGNQFESVYFEDATTYDRNLQDDKKFLSKSGFRGNPFVAPRWDVTGTETYGRSPGMDALGDVKMLQKMEEKKLKALDKQVDPPMNAPATMKTRGTTTISGGVNYVDVLQGQQGFGPSYQVNTNVPLIGVEIQRVEDRIRRFFFNDLFLTIITADKGMTATEVVRRHEEKLIMLGPVLERLQSEMLGGIIDRIFSIMLNLGMIPPAPPALQGQEIKVEYISLLAQAQQLVAVDAIERTAAFAVGLAASDPAVLDKLNMDQMVDRFSQLRNAPADIIRSDEEVAAIREAKAAAAAQERALAMGESLAGSAKDLSKADVGDQNALERFIGPQQ